MILNPVNVTESDHKQIVPFVFVCYVYMCIYICMHTHKITFNKIFFFFENWSIGNRDLIFC